MKSLVFSLLMLFGLNQTLLASGHFASISDIHFTPFTSCSESVPCPLIEKLDQAPVEKWGNILASDNNQPPVYKHDSNYALLQSALNNLKQTATKEKAEFILVLGDYLGHSYRELYLHYASHPTQANYQQFVKKTMVYMANEMKSRFPNTPIYAAVGNNDSYQGDYAVDRNGEFFKDFTSLWLNNLKDQEATAHEGGYYAVTIPNQPGMRLIVLNSVFFYQLAQGEHVAEGANIQLEWLHQELIKAEENKQQVLLAMHIPPGVDAFNSLHQQPFKVVELYRPEYTKRLLSELGTFGARITAILPAHYHMDAFQIVRVNGHNIPMSFTPSVSPLFSNNPSFKIFEYNTDTLQLEDMSTYIYPLEKAQSWFKEYSFNDVYQPTCQQCRVIDGMMNLPKSGELTEKFINYFDAGRGFQPIKNDWMPYYWCQMQTVAGDDYAACLLS